MDNTDLLARLQQSFGPDAFSDVEQPYGLLTLTIDRANLLPVVSFLKEQEGFSFLTDLCGIHYPEAALPLGVVYHLHHLPSNTRLRLKAFMPDADPTIDSLTPLFSAADWMERETFDFFGILFQGHPNLKRILNMDDMEAFPLRKEHPLEDPNRRDKDDAFFGR